MRLKVLTTTLVVAGLLLMLAWPLVAGSSPGKAATRAERVYWGRKLLIYFTVTASVWVCVAGSAVMLARQTRREFLKAERDNLQALIEGTLRDHGRKP